MYFSAMLFPLCPVEHPVKVKGRIFTRFARSYLSDEVVSTEYVSECHLYNLPNVRQKSGKVQAPDIRPFSMIFPLPGSRYVISPMSGKISAISSTAGYPAISYGLTSPRKSLCYFPDVRQNIRN